MSEKEILGLEDKRFGAMIKGDFKALDAMVHEQLFYTHSSGNTDTKPSWLESMKSGRTKYKAVNCSDRKVRVFAGRAAIEAEIGGQPRSLKLLFLNAWTKIPRAGNSSPGNRRRCRLERRLFGQARRRPPADRQGALYRRLEPAGTALRVLPALRQGARRPRGQGSKGH
jgi:hypothetical protein